MTANLTVVPIRVVRAVRNLMSCRENKTDNDLLMHEKIQPIMAADGHFTL